LAEMCTRVSRARNGRIMYHQLSHLKVKV